MSSSSTSPFKSRFPIFGRSKRHGITDENAVPAPRTHPCDKPVPRKSTSQAPMRAPLAQLQLQPQPPIVSASKADRRGHKNLATARTSAKTEQKPASIKRTISTMLSNAIRCSSSAPKDVVPVRGGDGKFLPPMHLANRKGSRYAPKPASSVSVKQAPVAQPDTTVIRDKKAAEEIAPVKRALKPLRLVNKVLSEGYPVANLVPEYQEVEVNQHVVENEETNERVVIIEMKIAKKIRQSSDAKQADPGRGLHYPLARRSVAYKPAGTLIQPVKRGDPNDEEIAAAVECAFARTSSKTPSMSSASTSLASTPTPSPVKLTGIARRETSTKRVVQSRIPKAAMGKRRGLVDGQARVKSEKNNVRDTIPSPFSRSTLNVKQEDESSESLVQSLSFSNAAVKGTSEISEEVKRQDATDDSAKAPIKNVGTQKMPSENDGSVKAENTSPSPSSTTSPSEEIATASIVTPPSRVKSLLQHFQQLATPPQSGPRIWEPRSSSPPTASSPAVYSLRPAIPAHLANKIVANPDIQMELDYLRTTSVAARSRTVLQRARMFREGSSSGSDSGRSSPSTPGGVWHGLRTPTSSPESGCDGDNENSPESKLSLRAMAIAHRVRNARRE